MKKSVVSLMIFLLWLSIIMVGCGADLKQSGEKVVVVGSYRDGTIDKLDADSYNGPHYLYKMIYEGLVEDGGNGEIKPALATSWDISEDGRTYTFHLREGVKFTDGTDFNAEAVIFNMKRWVNDKRHAILTASKVENMEALDEHTVRIIFKNKAYQVLTELTYPRPNRFISPASLKKNEETGVYEFTSPVGTGPWMVDSYVKDQEFTLVPNPDYWGEKPKIDKIVFKVIPDAQARVMALKSGEIDILGGDLVGKIPMESFVELRNADAFSTFTKSTQCSHFIAFNQKNKVFQDKNVRLAMNYAIDKNKISENLFDGIGAPANGLYQKNVPYTTNQNNYGYAFDKEKAKELLDQAGYVDIDQDGIREKNGEKLEFNFVLSIGEFPEWKTLAEFLQSEFADIGVKVNLNTLDKNAYDEAISTTKNFDMALMRTSSDSWVPHGSMLELFAMNSQSFAGKAWYDEGLYKKIKNTFVEQNEVNRQKDYDEVFDFISSEALTIPVYYPITTFAVNENKIKNFVIGVNSYAPIEWQLLDIK